MDPPSPQLKILVADDSPVYRKLVEQSLSSEVYTVLLAKNGCQALDLFAEYHPGLVITDWTMPDISGIELCRRVRQDFRQYYAYIIILTGHTDKEEIIEGLASGADDYLTKPFYPAELRARVEVGRRIVELHREIEAKNRLLEELSLTDSLTGLPNRRAIELWASRQLGAAARHDFPIWLVMADLDFFKKVNDTYGHNAGDAVLKGFAEILKANTRQSDICGRLGGEEFVSHLRRKQGYTAAMVVEESRILQVSIFNTLQNNLPKVDFSKVLRDVITIADEVDSQLKQAMFSYVEPRPGSVWSAA
jgi:two-component system chemotaxis response regulator CheY